MNNIYKVITSVHAQNRIIERSIDYKSIIELLKSVKNQFNTIEQTGKKECIVIDNDNNFTVIFTIYPINLVKIITVIDKSNVFIKNNTKLLKVK